MLQGVAGSKPSVKVIMSSGFGELEVTQKFVWKGLSGFIQKPYKFEALREGILGLDLDQKSELGASSRHA